MEQAESNTHSFIIKIWLEEETDELGRIIWRGHITHVPGGERHYIQDLNAIPFFIEPYLKKMRAKLDSDSSEEVS